LANIIEVRNLTKIYEPDIRAVDDISFDVKEGEIFGFLGPNGAGKSTTIKILNTLVRSTSGSATVSGIDVDENPRAVREMIGYASQETGLDDDLTGRENLMLQCRFHHIPMEKALRKTSELLKTVDLESSADRPSGTYSGGMRRRLDLATALVSDPRVLFLDEPTTGLDPQSRRAIWDYIRLLNKRGTTIFLTTQYMEEADQLSDRLSIIDLGKIVAEGVPSELKAEIGADTIHLSLSDGNSTIIQKAMGAISGLPGVKEVHDCSNGKDDCNRGIAVFAVKGPMLVPQIVRSMDILGIAVEQITVSTPTLDDVFLKYTGRKMRVEEVKRPSKAGFRTMRRRR
jgi:ABC-2 type transport system ATP-binding protein